MTLDEWIAFGEVGISSKTMWIALKNIKVVNPRMSMGEYYVPSDPDDFSRCYKLVKFCHVERTGLDHIKSVFPFFAPIIDNWDGLVSFYEQKKHDKLYERLRHFEKEAMKLDGWIQTGPNSWERPNAH